MKRLFVLSFFICTVLFCNASAPAGNDCGNNDGQPCAKSDNAQISQNNSGSFSAQEYWKRKHEYLAEKAELTDSEKDAFFPLYDELNKKKRELNHKVRQQNQAVQKSCNNEEECLKALDLAADTNIRIARLEKEYLEKFKQVLSASKLLKIQNADEEFNSSILKDIQKTKSAQPQGTKAQVQQQPAA